MYHLYKVLKTRRKGYERFAQALLETEQRGALKLLLLGFELQGIKAFLHDCKIHIDSTFVLGKEIEENGQKYKLRDILPDSTYINKLVQSQQYDHDLADCLLLNGGNLKLLSPSLPDEPSIYISRLVSNKIALDPNIFRKDAPDIFVFKGLERCELTQLAKPEITSSCCQQILKVSCRFIWLAHENHWEDICSVATAPVHLISCETSVEIAPEGVPNKYSELIDMLGFLQDSEPSPTATSSNTTYYYLQRTKGNSKLINSWLSGRAGNDSPYTAEADVVKGIIDGDLGNGICICDSPGMGKSFLLAHLARSLSTEEKFSHLIFLNGTEFATVFTNQPLNGDTEDTTSTEDVLTCVLLSKSYTNFAAVLLKQAIINGRAKLFICIDGIEQVFQEQKHVISSNLKKLSTIQNVTLMVTCRSYLRSTLEELLGVVSFDILPFSEENQIDYFVQHWKKDWGYDATDDLCKAFAKKCISNWRSKIDERHEELLGVPLQCHLMATVCSKDAKFFLDAKRKTQPVPEYHNVLTVFELYSIYVSNSIKSFASCHAISEVSAEKLHIFKALEVADKNLARLYSNFSRIEDIISTADFVTSDMARLRTGSNMPESFVHNSVAEFLVAKLMANLLSSTVKNTDPTINAALEILHLASRHYLRLQHSYDILRSQYITNKQRTPNYKWKKGKVFYFQSSAFPYFLNLHIRQYTMSSVGKHALAVSDVFINQQEFVYSAFFAIAFVSENCIYVVRMFSKYFLGDARLFAVLRGEPKTYSMRQVVPRIFPALCESLLNVNQPPCTLFEDTECVYSRSQKQNAKLVELNKYNGVAKLLIKLMNECDDGVTSVPILTALNFYGLQTKNDLNSEIKTESTNNGQGHMQKLGDSQRFAEFKDYIMFFGMGMEFAKSFNTSKGFRNSLAAPEQNIHPLVLPPDYKFLLNVETALMCTFDSEGLHTTSPYIDRNASQDFNRYHHRSKNKHQFMSFVEKLFPSLQQSIGSASQFSATNTNARLPIDQQTNATMLSDTGKTLDMTGIGKDLIVIFEAPSNIRLIIWYLLTYVADLADRDVIIEVENVLSRGHIVDMNGCFSKWPNAFLTPLHVAAGKADYDIVEYYIEHIPLNNSDLLCYVVANTHADSIAKIEIRKNICNLLLNARKSLLHDILNEDMAVRSSIILVPKIHPELIDYLVKKGVSIRSVRNNRSVVHNAASYMSPDEFLIFCHYLVDVHQAADLFCYKEHHWESPIREIIVHNDHEKALKFILSLAEVSSNINRYDNTNFNLVLYASQYGRLGSLNEFLSPGGYFLKKDGNGKGSLHLAAKEGRIDLCRTLIEKGFSPNELDYDGNTPLHEAYKHIELVQLLIEAKADPLTQNANGNTFCHNAAQDILFVPKKFDQLVQYIIKTPSLHNALSIKNYRKRCVLHERLSTISRISQVTINKILGTVEINVNDRDELGNNFYLSAVSSGKPVDTLKLLAQKGADPFAENKHHEDSLLCLASLIRNVQCFNADLIYQRFGYLLGLIMTRKKGILFGHRHLKEFIRAHAPEYILDIIRNHINDVRASDSRNKNVFHHCVEFGNFVALMLIASDSRVLSEDYEQLDEDQQTPILCISLTNKNIIEILNFFVGLRVDLSRVCKAGHNVAHKLSLNQNISTEEYKSCVYLLAQRYDRCIWAVKDKTGATPIYHAIGTVGYPFPNLTAFLCLMEPNSEPIRLIVEQTIEYMRNQTVESSSTLTDALGKFKTLENPGDILNQAIIGGDTSTLELLIFLGADQNCINDPIRPFSVIFSVTRNLLEIIEILVKRNVGLSLVCGLGNFNILHALALCPCLTPEKLHKLTELFQSKGLQALWRAETVYKETPMAVILRTLDVLPETLFLVYEENDISVNTRDELGLSILGTAVATGRCMRTIEALVNIGADVKALENTGTSVLHLAVQTGHISAVRYLTSKGCDVNIVNLKKQTPLHYIGWAASNVFLITQCLINAGSDVCAVESNGYNVGHLMLSNILIRPEEIHQWVSFMQENAHGTIFSMRDLNERTPLLHSMEVMEVQQKTISMVLENTSADVNDVDSQGNNMLLIGALCGRTRKTLSALVELKCDCLHRNNLEMGMLHMAVLGENIDAILYGVSRNININQKSISGSGPIHLVAYTATSSIKLTELLLSKGADLFAIDNMGNTIAHLMNALQPPETFNEWSQFIKAAGHGRIFDTVNIKGETPHQANKKDMPIIKREGVYQSVLHVKQWNSEVGTTQWLIKKRYKQLQPYTSTVFRHALDILHGGVPNYSSELL